MADNLEGFYDEFGKVISKDEVEWLCAEHQIGDFKKVIGLAGTGRINTNIRIETSKGEFVLRYLGISASKERIDYIEEILNTLKEANIPVVNAISNTLGQHYSLMINNNIVQVYPYIHADTFRYKTDQIKSCGQMLRKFHDTLSSYKSGPAPETCNYPINKTLELELNKMYKNKNRISKDALKHIQSIYNSIMHGWSKINARNLPETILHDDWHPWNLLYNDDCTVAAILDFDYMRKGKRIFDIAYAVYCIYVNELKKPNEKASLFLNSYGNLTPEEERALPLAIANVSLLMIFYGVFNKSKSKLTKIIKKNESFIRYVLSTETSKLFRE